MTTYKLHSSIAYGAVYVAGARRKRAPLGARKLEAAARRTLAGLDDAPSRELCLDRTEVRSTVSEALGDAGQSRLRLSGCPHGRR